MGWQDEWENVCGVFSQWVKFDGRNDLGSEILNCPGIYAVAIVEGRGISGEPFTLIEQIAYFGMTNAQNGLAGRLNAFNNTLRDVNGPGHGGAERFRYGVEGGEAIESLANKLYVAVRPYKCDVTSIAAEDLKTMGDVVRAEYLAFAAYANQFKRLPQYNDKRRSPKCKVSLQQA
ncbi:MAG: hypothetical protein FD134_2292 [Gallionellaceae bacterium]|nr:MAG: hypothetical protein FD134_2292 [Gallionellaceae bacterium]